MVQPSKIRDRCESDWIEAGAAYKQPVDFRLRHETLCIFWLDTATDPVKRWVVNEEHGSWDEATKRFKNRATTLFPNKPKHCLSLDDVLVEVQKRGHAPGRAVVQVSV
jgi:hypothetical protein